MTFAYIWIANSSEGTVSKIRTEDGFTEAKYRTGPNQGAQPSRTSVNQYGDVAVSNRDPSSVTKISAVLSRCVDKNNNGMIDTSQGLNDVLPWGEDECVVWHHDIPNNGAFQGGARATAWEGTTQDQETCETPVPRLWVGYRDNGQVVHILRLDGDTGEVLDDVPINNWNASGWAPYGGAVNSAGDFITTGYNNERGIRVDAETLEVIDLGFSPDNYKYGMGVDQNGNAWVGSFSGPHNLYFYDMQAQQWEGLGNGGGSILGVAIDGEGRVWGAGTGPCRLVEADVETKTFTNTNIALPGCGSPWGVSVDNEGFIWVVDKANQAFKVDPDTYNVELVVTELVGPYTYSDMTGQGLQLVIIQ